MRFSFSGNYPVTTKFGVKSPAYVNYPDSRHPGTDFAIPANTPLLAGMAGIITIYDRPSLKTGRGKEVSITFANLRRNTCHMNRIDVVNGQFVQEGQQIGLSGFTGYCVDAQGNIGTPASAHLHDECIENGQYVDLELKVKEQPMNPTSKQIDDAINQARILAGFPASDLDTFLKVYRPELKNNFVQGHATMMGNLIKDPNSAINKPQEFVPVGELYVRKAK